MSECLAAALLFLALVFVALVPVYRDLCRAQAAASRVRATLEAIERRTRASGASVQGTQVVLGFTRAIRDALDGTP